MYKARCKCVVINNDQMSVIIHGNDGRNVLEIITYLGNIR